MKASFIVTKEVAHLFKVSKNGCQRWLTLWGNVSKDLKNRCALCFLGISERVAHLKVINGQKNTYSFLGLGSLFSTEKKNSGKFFHLEKIVTVFFAVMDTQCRIPMSTGGGSGKSGKRQIGEQTCWVAAPIICTELHKKFYRKTNSTWM